MPQTPIVVEEFPGLNLTADPTVGSPDMLNVTFDRTGSIRTRDGTSKFTPSALSGMTGVTSLSGTSWAGRVLVAQTSSNTVKALDATGTVLFTTTKAAVPTSHSYANFGPAGAPRTYIADGQNTLYYWAPAGFTTPAYTGGFTPVGNHLAAWQDRLVLACNNGTVPGNASRVWFSAAGDPSVWTYGAGPPETGNFVDLDPADGEAITGVAVYQNTLLVFKSTKFFVFYGTSTDSTGGAVFNFRRVDLRVGAVWGTPVATPIGVCFANAQGVWVTQGANPQKLSSDIDTLFTGGASTLWSDVGLSTLPRLCWHENKLLVGSTASRRLLVWDGVRWSVWQLGGSLTFTAMASVDLVGGSFTPTRSTLLIGADTSALVYKLDSTVTTDDGTAITASYTSPFQSFGTQDVKKVRDTIVQGVGSPSIALSADFAAFPTAQTVTLGNSPATGEGRDRTNPRGRQIAFKLSSTSGAWRVDRLTLNLEQGRGQGEKP